ncbi:MAG: hypothetical protein PHO15_06960 [Eubacteriales bacterium]|nr:hypothetical protein [Eubacteriales bacterium]
MNTTPIHREKDHSDREEAELIGHMAGRGFADKLLLGMDTTSQRLRSYGAGFGLDYILTEFRKLIEEYAGEHTVRKIMTENPAKALVFI